MLKTYLIVFALIVIAGAIQGFVAGSMASLIAGGALGALILAGALLLGANPTLGLILALVGSLGVAGKFIPDFFKKGNAIWPAGTLALLATISLIWLIVTFVRR
jgi:uncharacterized membrane protein (UPF0136 family)